MTRAKVSRKGVYYDLSISPYEWQTPYGDIFKFSSKKKLEIYTRDVEGELERLDRILKRNDLVKLLPTEIVQLLRKTAYKAFYRKIEG